MQGDKMEKFLIFLLGLIVLSVSVQAIEMIEDDFGDYKFVKSHQELEGYDAYAGYARYENSKGDLFYVSVLEFMNPFKAERKTDSGSEFFEIIEVNHQKVYKYKYGNNIAWNSGRYYIEVNNANTDAVKAYLELYPSTIEGDVENKVETAKYKEVVLIKEDIGSFEYDSYDIEKGAGYKKYSLDYTKGNYVFEAEVYEFKNMYQARAYFAKEFSTSNILEDDDEYFYYGFTGYIVENIKTISWVSGRYIVEVNGKNLDDPEQDIVKEYRKHYPSDLTISDNYDIIKDDGLGYGATISFENEFYSRYQPGYSMSHAVVMVQEDSKAVDGNVLDLEKLGDYLGYDVEDAELTTKDESNYYYVFDAPDGNLYEAWIRGRNLYVIQKSGMHKDSIGSFTEKYMKKVPSHLLPTLQSVAVEDEGVSVVSSECGGCERADGYCYEAGDLVRTKDADDYDAYCSPSGKFVKFKKYGDECKHGYECESRQCRDSKCYDVGQATEGMSFLGGLWYIIKQSFKRTFS
jgi:hypothetical protein